MADKERTLPTLQTTDKLHAPYYFFFSFKQILIIIYLIYQMRIKNIFLSALLCANKDG